MTCRVERGGPVPLSFFGNLELGQVEPPQLAEGSDLRVAAPLDIARTKAAVVQR